MDHAAVGRCLVASDATGFLVVYHRSRGETGVRPNIASNENGFLDLPIRQHRWPQWQARRLPDRAVPLRLVETALLLASLRHLVRPTDDPALPAIRSLAYFLTSLSASERGAVTIATKFGEHWDPAAGGPFVDHSYDALRRSLHRTLERLGRIDVLQLHKTRPQVLASRDLDRA
jgi:hypothetical protein